MPKLDLHALLLQLRHQPVQSAKELAVCDRLPRAVLVAVALPLGDPRRHAFDQVLRIGLDDDLLPFFALSAAFRLQDERVLEGADRRAQFGHLAGWVQVRVQHKALVAARPLPKVHSCSGSRARPAVVGTRPVDGDDEAAVVGRVLMA